MKKANYFKFKNKFLDSLLLFTSVLLVYLTENLIGKFIASHN